MLGVFVYHWVELNPNKMGFMINEKDAALMLEGQHPDFKYEAVAEVEGADLELAFEKTNTIDKPWWMNEGVTPMFLGRAPGCRSTSTGDLMQVGGKYWLVAPVGFKEVKVN